MLEEVRNDVGYVSLRCLECICFAGESKPLVCDSLMVFCTSSRSFSSPTSLSILFYYECTHAQLLRPCMSPGSVSRTFLIFTLFGSARCRCRLGTAYLVRGIQPLYPRHPPHTCPSPASPAYVFSRGKLKRVPGPTDTANDTYVPWILL